MSRYLFGALMLFAAGIAPAADPELHVVSVYEGHQVIRDATKPGTAVVTVDRPGKEVILVVHAYNFTAWEVRATAKTTIKKVFALGYHRQHVAAPEGVKVEELTHDGMKDGVCKTYITGSYDIENVIFHIFARKIFDQTKLEMGSFQGTYKFDPTKPFVVDAIQNDERLSKDFPKPSPAAELPKLKFKATRIVFKRPGQESSGFGEFTQTGPTATGFVQLPKNLSIRQVTYDTKNKQYYGVDNNDFYSLDLQSGSGKKIDRPQGGQFGSLAALTYDAKRERILVSCRHGGLFEYTPKDGGKWKDLNTKRLGTFSALVWQSKTDTLFAFGVERAPGGNERRILTLYELKTDGTVANKTVLGSPLFSGILGVYDQDLAELVDLGGELALLVHSENRDSNGTPGKQASFLYVIDPKTGKVKLAWKE